MVVIWRIRSPQNIPFCLETFQNVDIIRAARAKASRSARVCRYLAVPFWPSRMTAAASTLAARSLRGLRKGPGTVQGKCSSRTAAEELFQQLIVQGASAVRFALLAIAPAFISPYQPCWAWCAGGRMLFAGPEHAGIPPNSSKWGASEMLPPMLPTFLSRRATPWNVRARRLLLN